MSIELVDNGKNNLLQSEASEAVGSLRIVFHGDNNRVVIGRGCSFNLGFIEFGSECAFEAGDGNLFNRMRVYGRNRARILFGSRNGFTWETTISAHEPSTIQFGNECLVASGCNFTSSDMHSIIDQATGRRINPAADITIEDHVWLGEGARVLKGAHIGTGSVIGAGTIVTSTPVPANVVVAGSPAKVVRRGIIWAQELLHEAADDERGK